MLILSDKSRTRSIKYIFGRLTPISISLGLLSLWLLMPLSDTKAQGAYSWAGQERIPAYYQFVQEPPYLIADQNNTVHAFNSQPVSLEDENSLNAVVYRQWTKAGGWTFPNDILYNSSGGIDLLDVASDRMGRTFLIFQQDFQDVYFTSAYLAEAGNGSAWSYPILIGQQSRHVSVGFDGVGCIVVTESGTVMVVYSGSEYGNGLYSVHSLDHGNTWSNPNPLYLTGDELIVVTDPELVVADSGMVHAVWSTYNDDGSGGPAFYASYDPELEAWSEPFELDAPGIRTPSVIEHEGNIVVSYYHRRTNGNWWRYSSDGGKTWTEPSQLSPQHVGTNGRVSFLVDSSNTLHGFFGERINDLNHGMWQMTWMNGFWTAPAAVVKGPSVRDVIGGDGFDPRSARAVVSNGNTILVTWTTDGFAGANGVWYSYRTTDAPALPSIIGAVPTPESQPTIARAITSTASTTLVSQTPIPPAIGPLDQQGTALLSPQVSILAGSILAILLVGAVLVGKIRSESRK